MFRNGVNDMKKITLGLMLFMCIGLTSCGGGSPARTAIFDKPSSEIVSQLNLNSVSNGVSLRDNSEITGAYVDVKIAADASSTFFYNTLTIEDYMDEQFKAVSINTLFFNGNILSSDANAFISEMNNVDYGITASRLGHNFEENDNNASLLGNLAVARATTLPAGYEKVEGKIATLAIVYLPTYCVYNDGTQDYTKVYFMVPVYYCFTYAVNGVLEDSNLAGIKNYQVELNEKGLLPSEVTE